MLPQVSDHETNPLAYLEFSGRVSNAAGSRKHAAFVRKPFPNAGGAKSEDVHSQFQYYIVDILILNLYWLFDIVCLCFGQGQSRHPFCRTALVPSPFFSTRVGPSFPYPGCLVFQGALVPTLVHSFTDEEVMVSLAGEGQKGPSTHLSKAR